MADKLWKLCREIIYLRDYGVCQHCMKKVEKGNAHCSHVIPKSVGGALRYDLTNLKLLCYHCHLNWWHLNPMEAGEWFKKTFPDRWKYLESAERLKQNKLSDLEELYEQRFIEKRRLEEERKNG